MTQSEVLTFDCYGTLIDWETGIRTAFKNAIARTNGPVQLAQKASEIYESEERKVEKQTPHLAYREVLAKTALKVATRIGWTLSPGDSPFLAKELPHWQPFTDTNPALARLGKKHTLGILSNIDNDLLELTLKHLRTKFEIIVTAERVGSYKPGLAHFEEAQRIIGDRPWIHIASSIYHDIEPANKLGIRAAWVNRKHLTKPKPFPPSGVWEVDDLLQLAERLHV
jgi:2-haloalkanoic acid dehalogenase type II